MKEEILSWMAYIFIATAFVCAFIVMVVKTYQFVTG